ncbi:peptide chain release factor N(5)-glutamine methyltransferase [Gorillibacterium sp. sgz5001074]|uniref:peptide chain release factor N(5)-glutamine methyltransferase n=1 Tax=Gorillibacterium sp. sgz5001074 TaxID=3446695 RepID=UPI003F67AA1C
MDDISTKTIREAFVEASSFLNRHGVDEASLNGELLLMHLLGWSRTKLLSNWQDPFPADLELQWQKLLGRRAAGEPVQYVIGEEGFYGLTFRVGPAVLIPRPETEILVQEILARGKRLWPAASAGPAEAGPLLADIGTGSGAIPVTVAAKCPGWQVAAVDISPAALEIARGNAAKNGLPEDRIRFYEGDLLQPLIESGVKVDILVSNPPYIPTEDLEGLQREVRDYEPHLALDGGQDGLIFYRRLVSELRQLPQLPRLVGFEVGMGQAGDVAGMLKATGAFGTVDIIRDLSGIDRHVLAEASSIS